MFTDTHSHYRQNSQQANLPMARDTYHIDTRPDTFLLSITRALYLYLYIQLYPSSLIYSRHETPTDLTFYDSSHDYRPSPLVHVDLR